MGDNPANTDPVGANDTSAVATTAGAAGAQGTNPTAPHTTPSEGLNRFINRLLSLKRRALNL